MAAPFPGQPIQAPNYKPRTDAIWNGQLVRVIGVEIDNEFGFDRVIIRLPGNIAKPVYPDQLKHANAPAQAKIASARTGLPSNAVRTAVKSRLAIRATESGADIQAKNGSLVIHLGSR